MPTLYHHIEPDNFAKFGVTENPSLPDEVSFIDGQPMNISLPNPLVFMVNYPARSEPPHLLGDTIPVFSALLVETLKAAGVDNFEVFPAVLKNPKTGKEWNGYFAFNALGIMAAANLSESKYDTLMKGDPEGVETPLVGFHTIVLDKAKVQDLLMLRLAESPEVLLVHDTVMNQIVANRPASGWGFDATEVDVV